MPASQPKVSRRTAKVWDRLRQWYGARLTDQYGAAAPPDWCALIDRTDDERLESAMTAVRRESPVHPPTLGQLEGAIPKRDLGSGSGVHRNEIDRFADFAVTKLTHLLCPHQVARPWNFFGRSREFVSKHRNNEVIVHADIRGVQIPACVPCERSTHRVMLDEMPRGWDALTAPRGTQP